MYNFDRLKNESKFYIKPAPTTRDFSCLNNRKIRALKDSKSDELHMFKLPPPTLFKNNTVGGGRTLTLPDDVDIDSGKATIVADVEDAPPTPLTDAQIEGIANETQEAQVIGQPEAEEPEAENVPVEPVEPMAPVAPTEPVEPMAPAAPTAPTAPTEPTEPTEPTSPNLVR